MKVHIQEPGNKKKKKWCYRLWIGHIKLPRRETDWDKQRKPQLERKISKCGL